LKEVLKDFFEEKQHRQKRLQLFAAMKRAQGLLGPKLAREAQGAAKHRKHAQLH
jgi:type II secretory pathway component PulJ